MSRKSEALIHQGSVSAVPGPEGAIRQANSLQLPRENEPIHGVGIHGEFDAGGAAIDCQDHADLNAQSVWRCRTPHRRPVRRSAWFESLRAPAATQCSVL